MVLPTTKGNIMTTVLLVLILLALLWISVILFKLNSNFVLWANEDVKMRKSDTRH